MLVCDLDDLLFEADLECISSDDQEFIDNWYVIIEGLGSNDDVSIPDEDVERLRDISGLSE